MSRMPAITPLLNGQAVNVRLDSTSVTAMFRSSFFSARATVAPAKPPPTTTTCGAACASAGRGNSDAAAADASTLRRVMAVMIALSLLLRPPGGDRLDLLVGESLGNLVHDGGLDLAGAERPHLPDDVRGIAAGKRRHRAVDARRGRMAAAARRRAGRRLGSHRRRDHRPHEYGNEAIHGRTPLHGGSGSADRRRSVLFTPSGCCAPTAGTCGGAFRSPQRWR